MNVPQYPTWPGLDSFTGPKFHTSRWEHEHDLTDKTVALVGTGSTASQIVPEIAPSVRKLYLFQREPGWVIPKGDRDYTPEERARLRNPVHYRVARPLVLDDPEAPMERRDLPPRAPPSTKPRKTPRARSSSASSPITPNSRKR